MVQYDDANLEYEKPNIPSHVTDEAKQSFDQLTISGQKLRPSEEMPRDSADYRTAWLQTYILANGIPVDISKPQDGKNLLDALTDEQLSLLHSLSTYTTYHGLNKNKNWELVYQGSILGKCYKPPRNSSITTEDGTLFVFPRNEPILQLHFLPFSYNKKFGSEHSTRATHQEQQEDESKHTSMALILGMHDLLELITTTKSGENTDNRFVYGVTNETLINPMKKFGFKAHYYKSGNEISEMLSKDGHQKTPQKERIGFVVIPTEELIAQEAKIRQTYEALMRRHQREYQQTFRDIRKQAVLECIDNWAYSKKPLKQKEMRRYLKYPS
jgi:hypothetical protein